MPAGTSQTHKTTSEISIEPRCRKTRKTRNPVTPVATPQTDPHSPNPVIIPTLGFSPDKTDQREIPGIPSRGEAAIPARTVAILEISRRRRPVEHRAGSRDTKIYIYTEREREQLADS